MALSFLTLTTNWSLMFSWFRPPFRSERLTNLDQNSIWAPDSNIQLPSRQCHVDTLQVSHTNIIKPNALFAPLTLVFPVFTLSVIRPTCMHYFPYLSQLPLHLLFYTTANLKDTQVRNLGIFLDLPPYSALAKENCLLSLLLWYCDHYKYLFSVYYMSDTLISFLSFYLI